MKQPYLKGLPIVDDDTKLEKFMLGVYPLYDRTGITLSDFIPYREKAYNWSNAPTREGRTMLVQVFINFQKVMVVYHGEHYGSCCEDVLTLLQENADILRKFNDAYIQIKFEMTLSHFFQDIYKEKESLAYPSMKMDSPIYCAALLKMYLNEEVKSARGERGEEKNWEIHPHSFFYSAEGEYSKNIFVNTVVKVAAKSVVKNVSFEKSTIEDKEICLWHLGSQLGVEASSGKRVECRHKETCRKIHKTLHNTTKYEATAIIEKMTNGKLKTSFEKQMSSVTGFKKSPTKNT